MKVYLAGGMRTKWRDIVKAEAQQFDYLDPIDHNFLSPKNYTNWDLRAVKRSDIIFAYMESNNPSGIGLSVEVGFAKALNKIIIFVNGKAESAYFLFVEECADIVVYNLDDGIDALVTLADMA